MKNTNYILAALFMLLFSSLQAQFVDDMESYTDGSPIFQDHWTSWSETITDAGLCSSNQAHSGVLSYYVDGNGVIDGLLDLGSKIFGIWSLEMWAYVPSGKMGYYNVTDAIRVIPNWYGEFYFNRDGSTTGSGEVLGQYETTFSFPQDQWFRIFMNWDISAGISLATWEMSIDGVTVVPPGTLFVDTDGNAPIYLGGLNFFSAHVDCEFYIDSASYTNGLIGTEDFNRVEFKAYPNPVTNILTLQAKESIQSISIYNTLGQLMYSEELNALTTQIDMSNYEKGVYFVNTTIGTTEGTLKIIK